MRRQASNSWNHFGVRGSDGVLEALPLRTCIYRSDWLGKKRFAFRQNPTDGKPLFRVEWRTLNLKRGDVSETLSTMPPEARKYGTAVACGNRIYVLGGECTGDLFCPDGKFNNTHFHNCVFYFDSARPNCGWKRGPSMLVSRWFPSAVAAGGKIYVFGSTRRREGYFAEVFSVELDRWDRLPEPPVAYGLVPESVSDHVLLDASRSRILVHFKSNNSLQAFHFHADGGSWECVDPEFGVWSEASVIVGFGALNQGPATRIDRTEERGSGSFSKEKDPLPQQPCRPWLEPAPEMPNSKTQICISKVPKPRKLKPQNPAKKQQLRQPWLKQNESGGSKHQQDEERDSIFECFLHQMLN
ncbi:hypothetical protein V6N12_033453 [Hibiscus sabdariffa]|uniref:Kelch repeat-containing protein n=1 Tax=Hibiscus sabdariffa TaxID=183260 RepID=A0ABR2BVL8_9ROSI